MTSAVLEGFRLSPQQEELWQLQQNGNAHVYNTCGAVRLSGALDVGALKQAVQHVVTSYEILRTSFQTLPGMSVPLQVIANEATIEWYGQVDLGALTASEQSAHIDSLLSASSAHGSLNGAGNGSRNGDNSNHVDASHVGNGPASGSQPQISAQLAALAADEHLLVLNVPALLVDASGLQNVVAEIAQAYADYSNGGLAPQLDPEELLQYINVSEWLNELLESEEAEAGKIYWREQVAEALAILQLPLERQVSSGAPFVPAVIRTDLSNQLALRIQEVASRYNTTTETLLNAAWSILISRLTQQSQLVIGTTCHGRSDEELEEAIGLLARCLPISVEVDTSASLPTLLAQLDETLETGRHWQECYTREKDQHLPFCFEHCHLPDALTASGVTYSVERLHSVSHRVKAKLTAIESSSGLSAELQYDSSLYHESDMRRLAAQFEALIESICAAPEGSIGSFNILGNQERQQLLVDWNATTYDYPGDKVLHNLFEEQVAKTPDNIALVFEGQTLSYSELDVHANQLAHRLQSLGVTPGTLVGICMERSLEMVVAIFGVLKAGGAYVPIDPSYPAARVTFMLTDSQAPLLLTLSRHLPDLPESKAAVLCLDAERDQLAQEPTDTPVSNVGPEDPAYVIYTSGSTGTPKGALLPHRSITHHMQWMHRVFPLREADALLQKTPFSFDAAIWEFYAALMAGARLVIAKPEGHTDPAYLVELMAEHDISVLQVVPSLLRALLEEPQLDSCTALHRVFCGGEALTLAIQERFFQRSSAALINVYGPTEATIHTTFWQCQPNEERNAVPIGRPIDNVQVYVLDAQMNPVPIGVPGELCIAGTNVGLGYHNRPELTAEKFIDDLGLTTDESASTEESPKSGITNRPLYKSGDLVRWTPDGLLEFLGRVDFQVKVRGYRIELGEIEAILERHASVAQAVVVVREEESAQQRLIAYVVPSSEQQIDERELRSFLNASLPDYMVPATFVALDKLPQTPNGKVDRRALPAPSHERDFVPPSTPTEEMLAGIWIDVLKVDRVGTDDNFFDLGGHSLLATQVLARVRDTFSVEMSVRRLFEATTLASLAQLVDVEMRSASGIEQPPMERIARHHTLPVSFAQQRLWILDQLMPGTPLYNVPLAVRIEGNLDVDALRQTFQLLIDRHESLRTTFSTVDERPVQIIAEKQTVKLPVTDLRHLGVDEREEQAHQLATAEAKRSFDLVKGPLFRTALLQLKDDEYVLLLTVHHIISDAWSTAILIRETAEIYQGLTTDRAVELAELPLQYADYATWQRNWLQGTELDAQLDYWKGQLEYGSPPLELPADRPRPAQQTYRGAHHRFGLPLALAQQLRELSRKEGVSLYMLLMAAYKTLLYRYTGQDDISVGTAIAGRNRLETDPIVGFFVNTLVLRTELAGKQSFRELLQNVREVALGAYAHQDVPFEQLVEEIQPERNLSHTPLFQTMFTLQNAPQESIDLPGLHFQLLPVESEMAKYDLVLTMVEAGEQLGASFEYSTDLFNTDRIVRMEEHFVTLLQGIVDAPEAALANLPLLTEAEHAQVALEWPNRAVAPAHLEADLLHAQFEAQAVQTPDNIAVVFGDEKLTYRALNERANQLAHRLRSDGVEPDMIVGLCVERSVEMVVSVLGVLKAGGAYLPLDPNTPAERIRFMWEDAGCSILLTQQHLADQLPAFSGKRILLDNEWPEIAKESVANLDTPATATSLAYIIYTSGSTGKPKGVLIENGSIASHIQAMRADYQLTATDRVLQFTAFTFDASLEQIFITLTTGAQLVLPGSTVWSPAEFYQKLHDHELSVINLPTIYWQQMVQEWSAMIGVTAPDAATTEIAIDISHLRLVIISGEEMSSAAVDLWKRLPTEHITLLNAYGPTETTITATTFDISNAQSEYERVPIGVPTPNRLITIMDPHGNPCPIGVPGELCIGGPHLARGYLNQPVLTSQRFIDNLPLVADEPVVDESVADESVADESVSDQGNRQSPLQDRRLYKTGDLARYLPDGNIEFMGRVDYQVKIRGYRIELGEIESALRQHPAVSEVVVLARGTDSADSAEAISQGKQLVAYLVCGNAEPPTNELRHLLRTSLPDYMVPSHFMMMKKLPLTPNGKLDRKALPAPDGERPDLAAAYVAPRNQDEEAMATIWGEVLGLERVGIYDQFFELGGHSLLATQVVSRVRSAFELELPMRYLFESPTVAGLTERIQTIRWATQAVPDSVSGEVASGDADDSREEGEL